MKYGLLIDEVVKNCGGMPVQKLSGNPFVSSVTQSTNGQAIYGIDMATGAEGRCGRLAKTEAESKHR